MDVRARMRSVAPITGTQFAAFRIAFGLYLLVHFAHLMPWGRELFSGQGVLADPRVSPLHGILPNVLAVWDSPHAVAAFLLTMVIASLAFTLGLGRRAAAVVLWYGWACLFSRNPLISNPSIPYVGLLLLLSVLVPAREPLRLLGRRSASHDFYFPGVVFFAAWFLMATGYTFSGVIKLSSPSWVDGTALWHLINNPLARVGWMRDLFLNFPMPVFQVLTWVALAGEILFLPLALWRWSRPIAWAWMLKMHLGILTLVSFADLTLGMVMLHLFTFDPRWVEMAKIIWRVHGPRRRAETVLPAAPPPIDPANDLVTWSNWSFSKPDGRSS